MLLFFYILAYKYDKNHICDKFYDKNHTINS